MTVRPSDAPLFTPPDYFREWRAEEIFPNRPTAPLEIDLGCGDGGFALDMAMAHPERNFLATERLLGRVRGVVKKIAASELTNVRVARIESAHTLGWCLPTGGVSRLHFLFPDPWPKARHEQRRLFRHPDFLRGLGRAFTKGGELIFKTDQRDLFDEMAGFMAEAPGWTRADDLPGDFYAETDFERLWVGEGRSINGARWLRREDPTPPPAE